MKFDAEKMNYESLLALENKKKNHETETRNQLLASGFW